jgi:3-deoxy-D-manno-octulosonic-acid transferase
MRRLLDVVYLAGLVASSPLWGWRLARTGKWRSDWAARLGRGDPLAPDDRPTLLLHAVSVGEVNLIRTLVDELLATGEVRVVVSTTTNTGWARATALYADCLPGAGVVRFPLDFSGAVDRLLDRVRPDVVAMVELELWPNFIAACQRRGIKLAVVNGRLSERSFRGYWRFKPVVGWMFAALDVAAVQSKTYLSRFAAMGTRPDRLRVIDTMKWDGPEEASPALLEQAGQLADRLGLDRDRPVVVAGSTAPGEERMLIEGLGEAIGEQGVQLVVAPRKPEWFAQAAEVVEAAGLRVVRWSGPTPGGRGLSQEPTVALLDVIGQLRAAYVLADVVVVGRSFVPLYGSDMMEPAALGKPIVIGPNHGDFAEPMAALQEAEAIIVADQPGPPVRELLADPQRAAVLGDAARQVVEHRRGGSAATAALLRGFLDSAASRPTHA